MSRQYPPWRVRTEDAARELCVTPGVVIWKMEHGQLPIGDIVRREGALKCSATIYRKLLDEYKKKVGIT